MIEGWRDEAQRKRWDRTLIILGVIAALFWIVAIVGQIGSALTHKTVVTIEGNLCQRHTTPTNPSPAGATHGNPHPDGHLPLAPITMLVLRNGDR